jgi:hypothetical protein
VGTKIPTYTFSLHFGTRDVETRRKEAALPKAVLSILIIKEKIISCHSTTRHTVDTI